MKSLEERAKAVGFTMNEIKVACCSLAESAYGVKDATMTWKDYWEVTEKEPPKGTDVDDPLWMREAHHFLRFCEMQQQINRLRPWVNGVV